MVATFEEHIEYMSDPRRLDLLREAIGKVVGPGDRVADVGCGFGIIGLMALEAGASEVWGIDCTEAIDIAGETLRRAGYEGRYHCLRDSSFRAQLPAPVDLAVCDHIGFFGFDYGIVEMLGDVRRRMLKPGGRILPERIRPIVAGVASVSCRAKAEAWARPPVPPQYAWLRDFGVNSMHPHVFDPADVATDASPLGEIDFQSERSGLFSGQATLQARADCLLDGLGGWFEADLAPGVMMTNAPLAPDRIARAQMFLPFEEPVALSKGESLAVTLSVRFEEMIVAWSARTEDGTQKRKQSTWRSLILGQQVMGEQHGHKLQPNALGRASSIVRSYLDGERSAKAIEAAVLRDHPQLFPSAAETVRFIKAELARFAQ
jgi:protein arginine N-methyltransferase 1